MKKVNRLFQPGRIGRLNLKNRIVMAPMAGLGLSDEFVTSRLIDFFVERAKGGAGLIIVSGGCVDPFGKVPGLLGIYEDKFVPGLGKLAQSVHAQGSKIGLLLFHGGRDAPSSLTGVQPASASAIRSKKTKEMSRELSHTDIHGITSKYAQAVNRAKEAGFDLVEFNAYSGYLLMDFLSPLINKRTDEYGGGIENRIRILGEIVERSRNETGECFPLVCKITGNEFLPGGNGLEEAKLIARDLEKMGVDALDVSQGGHESPVPVSLGLAPKGAFVYIAQAIKKEVSIPIITACIDDLSLAEEILEEGKADFVGFGRAFLADPDFPLKAQEGREEEIRKCCRCHQGCYDRAFGVILGIPSQPVTCMVNPSVGKEKEEELRTKPSDRRERVFVVGGGPGGMKAAEAFALRGHEVSLYEKRDRLGGQLNLASMAPGKEEFRNITLHLSKQLERLGVRVFLGKEVTHEYVLREDPDITVIATGAVPLIPELPGILNKNVVTPFQVLNGDVKLGEKVVIIGGGGIGCEVALFAAKMGAMNPENAIFLAQWGALDPETAVSLTLRGTKDVTILEKLPSIGKDIGITKRKFIQKYISMCGVNAITEVDVKRILASGVEILNKEGEQQIIAADTVIIAIGTRSDNKLYEDLKGKRSKLAVIGDAKKPQKALDAIYEGATLRM
jgi:2,4-dienoyl-CoA reductase (NADPH2)